MKPILYHFWRSSASWRVRWALSIKRVPFESVIVNLTERAQHTPEHRARNPIGHVPCLVVNGRHLSESVAILEYLEETIPDPPLYPKDPWARARVRQCVELTNAGIQPLQNLTVMGKHSEDPAAQREWAAFFNQRGIEAYEALLETIEREGGRGRFSVGDSLTAADLVLVPQVYSARRFGVDIASFPRVHAVEQAALGTEHAASARPENQPGAPAQAG
jgi:maleylacetoacetate isomerase